MPNREPTRNLWDPALAGFVLAALLAAVGIAAQVPVKAPAFDVFEKSIVELQDAMRAGRVTSKDLVEAYLARIRAYDKAGPGINAMISLNPKAWKKRTRSTPSDGRRGAWTAARHPRRR